MQWKTWLLTFGFVCKESINFLYGPVVGTDDKAMVIHVQDEVLALRGYWRGREENREEGEGERENVCVCVCV